ncbi:MAG: polysaccharide deacetylase family protein [Clostridia bacterium]|nr:polysaccharide deacetylase family protein [Clostridia bacterium]
MACICIVILAIVVLVLWLKVSGMEQLPQPQNQPQVILTLPPTETPVPTEAPTAEPVVEEATPEPTEAPAEELTFGGLAMTYEYLPVIHSGPSDSRRVAITVDDCFQLENMKTIASLAYQKGGRLTFFPIGENIVKPGMADILKTLVANGFEIENHTYGHERIFRMEHAEMASQIWNNTYALAHALGVYYHPHFFRFMGGDGEYDQRSHDYLKQLGYVGVADWSISGSDATQEMLMNALKPGAIFLFHTTDRDTEMLKWFIPYCVEQGYELVTMNTLLGYPENEMTDISTLPAGVPAPREYTVEYITQKPGDYSWSVVLIQRRLVELGYLTDTNGKACDGVYGNGTAEAVRRFQGDNGLLMTGEADPDTQKKLLEG